MYSKSNMYSKKNKYQSEEEEEEDEEKTIVLETQREHSPCLITLERKDKEIEEEYQEEEKEDNQIKTLPTKENRNTYFIPGYMNNLLNLRNQVYCATNFEVSEECQATVNILKRKIIEKNDQEMDNIQSTFDFLKRSKKYTTETLDIIENELNKESFKLHETNREVYKIIQDLKRSDI